MSKSSRVQIRQFHKSGCQLQQFPLIKLHIFSNIQVLDLSDNIISNLSSLEHHTTTPYVLSKLRKVNLSKNQFASINDLLPLARTASAITYLDISSNPLVLNLNFLYELALNFQMVGRIHCGYQVEVNLEVRQAMIRQQLTGGKIISSFLSGIQWATQRARLRRSQEEKEIVEGLLLELEQPFPQITQQNDQIFQAMNRFISQGIPSYSNSPTYRSPVRSMQIDTRSQYEVASRNGLLRYLTQGEQFQKGLIQFYYHEMVHRSSIGDKILQEIEVQQSVLLEIEEGRKVIPQQELLQEIRKKWNNNLIMTRQINPYQDYHSHSPFKSIQTDITNTTTTNQIFFGFDKEWTYETLQFIRHRLLSLLRTILKVNTTPIQDLLTFNSNSSSPQQPLPSTFSSRAINYQTFGASFSISHSPSPSPSPAPVISSPPKNVLSPKSRNKFIIGSLINVLEMIIKRIVLRRIRSARFLHPQECNYFQDILQRIARRMQQISFRKIYENAVFYECLQEKMDHFRMKIVFKAWKQIKKRKMKLLKAILTRKVKKEKALLSVFLTQMRLNSSNIGLQRKVQKTKAEMMSQCNELQDISCILKRSFTCQKSLLNKSKDSDRTIQARRKYLKRTK